MTEIRRLLHLSRPHWPSMGLAIALSLASVLSNVALMAMSGWFIAAMALAGAAGAGINYFTPAAIIRALAIVRTGGRYAERVVGHDATLRFLTVLRPWLYDRLEPLAPGALQGLRSGDLLARIRLDVDRLELLFLRFLSPVVTAALGSSIVVAVLLLYQPAIAMTEAALLIVGGVVLPVLVARTGREAGGRIADDSASLNEHLVDALEGLGELQVYGADEAAVSRINQTSNSLIAAETRLARLAAFAQAGVGLTAGLAMWGALALLAPLAASGVVAKADFAMLALLALAGFEAIMPVPLAVISLTPALASARRLLAVADAHPVVSDPASPEPPTVNGTLELHGVSLRYPGATNHALQDIDLCLRPGRRVAVLGPSGSGKSSLLALALRFYSPTSGTITLGGIPIERLRSEDVRALISATSQDAHLFSTTIADNLRIARPDATLAQMEQASRTAQIHDFIAAQPSGYDTFAGANGQQLSGGQIRRVAVAQALLKDAPILLLDEPTEGLDAVTEHAMMADVLAATRDRSVLVVTHRPVLLELMDEIVLLEDGRIVERGCPATLLNQSQRLREIVGVNDQGLE